MAGLERLKARPERFEQAYQEAGRQTMAQAATLLARAVVLRFDKPAGGLPPAINTGLLRSSVAWRAPRIEGRTIEGGVGTNVAYALPIEGGSRPHWPPRAPLEFWVRRRLRVPASQARGVAFLIARKIARRGTRARRIFALGLEDAKPRMAALFARLPRLILERMGA
ncbi:MAG: hypothetical protein HY600_05545 [Candidatus Omnitrophica bacterium]|nr:hypothetical protein [Candidatus Omnitrophota bacterium]